MILILRILKLIRLPNLIIMAFTMVTIRYAVLKPILHGYTYPLELNQLYFYFLVIATMLIAAGGYMINDYFDVETDRINKPDKLLVTKYFTPNSVFNAYIIVNVIGIALSLFVSYKLDMTKLFLVFPVSVGVLWFYSSTYKSQLLLGNILISGLLAGVTVLPALYELPLVYSKYKVLFVGIENEFSSLIQQLYKMVFIFGAFAFLTNLIREIIKDVEDIEGDKATGCNTLPIAIGVNATKIVIIGLYFILLSGLSYILYFIRIQSGLTDWLTMLYFIAFLFLPIIISVFFVIYAKAKSGFSKASVFIKLTMVFGVLYAWLLAV